MKTTSHVVDLAYTEPELQALFAAARREDVEEGGRYDAASAAIHVWSHGWQRQSTRGESTLIGTFYAAWADRHAIWQIDCEEGFALEDMLHELAGLEERAFGHTKHGKRRFPNRGNDYGGPGR